MSVPTEDISDKDLFGQRNVRDGAAALALKKWSPNSQNPEPRKSRSVRVGASRWAPPSSPSGVNFSVFSRQASRVDLLLFDDAAATHPARVIELDPRTHRTYHYWHVFVPGIRPGQIYAYRADGPFDPERGLRFDPTKALLDPYGRAVVVPDGYSRHAASRYGREQCDRHEERGGRSRCLRLGG